MSGRNGRLIMIGLALIGAAVIGNAVLYAFGVSPFNVRDIYQSQTVSADGISRIEIRTDDGDVRVVAAEGDAITATIEGRTGRTGRDGVRLSVNGRDGKAVIDASREMKRKLVSINPGEYELLVELPERLYEQVEIVAVAADISAADVRAEQISLRAIHGEIDTAGLAGNIEARTDAGDIELGVRAFEGIIRAETLVGDIEVVAAEAPEKLALDMRTRIGGKRVELPGTAIVAAGPDVPAVWLNADVGDLEVSAGK